ncbi:hypothetical protein [Sorangium sp. So ce693]|uniref:hypothetical protein n=1 Tax=Sorangium sp. So ce693 TaxID=3133318 RepID=UPI003F5DCDFA
MDHEARLPAKLPAALLLAIALTLAPSTTRSRRAAPRMPGPEPPRSLDPVAVNRDCERCYIARSR